MSREALTQEAALIAQDLVYAEARRRMLGFAMVTHPGYQVNWHHRRICNGLDRLVNGDINFLMIFMPPRTGKSELVSRKFPAYVLGRDPDAQIISASYSYDLARMMNLDVQRVMTSPIYKEIFPGTQLSGEENYEKGQGTWLRNSDVFEVIGRRGIYRSAGIGGGITGMGAMYGVIDDPFKNQKEADSPTRRKEVWDWWLSTFSTRLEKNAKVVITLTRWHEDDLAGRILAQPNHGFEVITFPMIKDEEDIRDPRKLGEALWPDKYDLEACQKIKTRSGSRVWNALYQQKPSAQEGGIFKRQWMQNFYTQLPDTFDEIIDSWDLGFKAKEDSDYCVGFRWGRKGGRFYLFPFMVRDRLDFPAAKTAIVVMRVREPRPGYVLIEDKANGPAIIASLKPDVPGLIAYCPDTSKEARAHSVSPFFEAGNVWLPNPEAFPWVSDYIEEMANFPNVTNDDQVDATTQALIRLALNSSGDFEDETDQSKTKTHAPSTDSGDLW